MDRQFLPATLFSLRRFLTSLNCLFMLFRELFPAFRCNLFAPTAVRLCLSKHAKRIFTAIRARVKVF